MTTTDLTRDCRFCDTTHADAATYITHLKDAHPQIAERAFAPPFTSPEQITDRDVWDRLIQANTLLELERIAAWRVAEEVCAVAESLDVWARETPDEMLSDALGEAVSRLRRAATRMSPTPEGGST